MKIQTFKLDNYRECPVYYRNFQDHFEYLTIIKGELFTAHITVRPHWLTKTFYILGIENWPYSRQQLKSIIIQLRRLAETTIDYILDKKDKE